MAAADDYGGSNFECNICLDRAQEPVITLCGHLHCRQCLYQWLRSHSRCHECPVCKSLIHEEKLIPLSGRGNTPTDRRSSPPPAAQLLSVQFCVSDFYGESSGYGYGYPYYDGLFRLNNESSISSHVEGNNGNSNSVRFWFIFFLFFAFLIM